MRTRRYDDRFNRSQLCLRLDKTRCSQVHLLNAEERPFSTIVNEALLLWIRQEATANINTCPEEERAALEQLYFQEGIPFHKEDLI